MQDQPPDVRAPLQGRARLPCGQAPVRLGYAKTRHRWLYKNSQIPAEIDQTSIILAIFTHRKQRGAATLTVDAAQWPIFYLRRGSLVPNAASDSTQGEAPSFEMRALPGLPRRAPVSTNWSMSFETATEIARLLTVEDKQKSAE